MEMNEIFKGVAALMLIAGGVLVALGKFEMDYDEPGWIAFLANSYRFNNFK